MKKDSKGHYYEDIKNVRVTYIPKSDRVPGKDWAGEDVLRIQAYLTETKVMPGAELPVSSINDVAEFISKVIKLYHNSAR